jgi:hypothetical protein
MKTEFEVTVNETQESKTFATLAEARDWTQQVRTTLGLWGSEPTFRCIKRTEEDVPI